MRRFKLLALAATFLFGSTAVAQTTEPAREDNGGAERATTQRYHVAPSFGVTTAMGEVAPTVGLRGSWGLSEIFAMGLGATALRFQERQGGQQSLVYVGPSFSWSLRPRQRVHPAFDVLVGYGHHAWESGSQTAISIEGAAGVDVDAARFVRIGLVGVARLSLVAHRHTLADDRLSGLGARMRLSFGRF